jgi:hypothetical protein
MCGKVTTAEELAAELKAACDEASGIVLPWEF